jgi:nucleoid-associated protein YgaU
VEDTVVLVCTVALGVVLLWLLVSTLVCLADVLRRREPSATASGGAPTGFFRPRFLVALLALVVGPLVTGLATAAAPGAQAHRRQDLPRLLAGLALPERPAGGVELHQVAVGESLWSIAADVLPEQAGQGLVARTWPQLYRLNLDRIGSDPDLIRPGTSLRLPAPGPVRRGPTRPVPTEGASR